MDSNLSHEALEKVVLAHLNDHGAIENTETYKVDASKEDLDAVLKSLAAEEYISLSVIERKAIELTDEGRSYAEQGSPEF